MRGIGAIAKLFEVDKAVVKIWCREFREYLSPRATSSEGNPRIFNDSDLLVLSLIYNYWEDEPDYDHIKYCLNSGEHLLEIYTNFLYSNTPIFREPPEELETEEYGNQYAVMLSSYEFRREAIQIARAYKNAGDALVKLAISEYHPHDLDYPIFFNYRHALELYLKVLSDFDFVQGREHNIEKLTNQLENKYNKKLPIWFRSRLEEISKIDPGSFKFRYPEDVTKGVPSTVRDEYIWIDLHHLRAVMTMIFSAFDTLIGPS